MPEDNKLSGVHIPMAAPKSAADRAPSAPRSPQPQQQSIVPAQAPSRMYAPTPRPTPQTYAPARQPVGVSEPQSLPRDLRFKPAGSGTAPHKGGFSFGAVFAIDTKIILFAAIFDLLTFSGYIPSAGMTYIIELIGAVVIGRITYTTQKNKHFDNHDEALNKALMLGLLTAIPVPVATILLGPVAAARMLGFGKSK